MKKLCVSIILMLVATIVKGQELPNIIPPSPEAISLAKFTNVPVNHYTGLPTISVPIYTIRQKDISIPISLSYHARGVRVEEIASRVGLGWALNAGGLITRQVRGKADELPNGYLTKNFYKDFEGNESVRRKIYNDDVNREIDLMPDQFVFNFLGYSGKFIFDQRTKKPIIQSYSDIKIERKSDESFVITTEDGYKFYFGSPEVVSENSRKAINKDFSLKNMCVSDKKGIIDLGVGTSIESPNNTWLLIDVISPLGNKIRFNYAKEESVFYRRSYDRIEDKDTKSYFSKVRSRQYQLKEIIFDKGRVVFNSFSKRDDLQSGFSLDNIEIKDTRNNVVDKFNFNYSYSNNTNSQSILPYLYNIEPRARKRLFLDAISRVSGNMVEPYYSMSYIDKNALPNRFSNSQDLWGYYNGAKNGKFLTFFNSGVKTPDRTVNQSKAKIGLLEKLIYPTGGYSEYIYEANKAITPSYFDNLYTNPVNPIQKKNIGILKDRKFLVSNGVYEVKFKVEKTMRSYLSTEFFINGNGGNCNPKVFTADCKYVASIEGVNGTSHYSLIRYGSHTTIQPLPIGDYKIRVKARGFDNPDDYENGFGISLSWDVDADPEKKDEPKTLYTGGSRIRQIKSKGLDNGIITKSYAYKKPNNESSGIIVSYPEYYYIEKTIIGGDGKKVNLLDRFGARPGSPFSYVQSNHTGYSFVTEYIDSSNEQGKGGKIEYSFTSMLDGGDYWKHPYTLPADNEWLRGKPLVIKYFRKERNTYNLVKQELFEYKYADNEYYQKITDVAQLNYNSSQLLYKKDRLQFNIPLIVFNEKKQKNHNDYKVYNLNGGVQKLYKKQEINYYRKGELKEETTYFYDYPNHYQIVSSEAVNSNGGILKSVNTFDSKLMSQNRMIPVKTEVFKNSTKLSEQKTVYSSNHNSANLYLPKNVHNSKANLGLEERLVYHRYDNKGNPTEVSKKDGTRIVYIWGYHQTQPIAKIENATLSEVGNSTISNLQILSNLDKDVASENTLRTELNKLLTVLSNAKVTTFTYDPLIGVTSITDSRGETVYYQYDNFNRLQFVKDAQGNILKEHKYKYKN